MKTNINTTNKLLKKFPVIKAVLTRVNKEADKKTKNDNLYIVVQRANKNLLHLAPEFNDGKYCSLTNQSDPNVLGWRTEIFFAVNEKHQIIGELGTLSPKTTSRDITQLKHLAKKTMPDLRYIVQVTVTGWCERIANRKHLHEEARGRLVSRDILVTVHRESKTNFQSLMNSIVTESNIRMHYGAAHFGINASDPNLVSFMNRLYPVCVRFRDEVLLNGFKDALPKKEFHDGTIGPVSFDSRLWANCYEEKKHDVELRIDTVRVHLRESGGNLYLFGIDATIEEAIWLVETAISFWKQTQSAKEALVAN